MMQGDEYHHVEVKNWRIRGEVEVRWLMLEEGRGRKGLGHHMDPTVKGGKHAEVHTYECGKVLQRDNNDDEDMSQAA